MLKILHGVSGGLLNYVGRRAYSNHRLREK